MRIVVVPDKFKGTLSARQAARAIMLGWKRARPLDLVDSLPMSDGGEGFGNVMSGLMGAKTRLVKTVDAAHRPRRARWWWEPRSRTAIIESAEVIGLAMLPAKRFDPFELDTAGLGRVLAAAARLRPRRCFIGIGGSATNDGGSGLARSLGWRFHDRNDEEIRTWASLASCVRITPPTERPKVGRLTVALDVQNPLLGPMGSTRVYGPQKGLLSSDFNRAETALRRISHLMDRQCGRSLAAVPGAGAAGGLGFGLMAFLGARPVTGFSLFAREAELRRRLRSADLVVTGEGCLDEQSLMGKGVGELVDFCSDLRVPCIAIGGRAELSTVGRRRFSSVYSLSALTSPTEALRRPGFWLSRTAMKAASDLSLI